MLQAEPGAGKSTIVPLALLTESFLNDQRIIMLEPRRMAARSLATYLASCLAEPVGKTVGYQVKNEKKLSAHTKLEIITEGIFTQRLQSNPDLDGIGLIIFDEFHERSMNTDVSLMLTHEIQQVLRDDLRLLVMSATLDTNLISSYLRNAPVILCEGRSFPVSVQYQTSAKKAVANAGFQHKPYHYLAENVYKAIQQVIDDDEGDVLIFLPGMPEINRCMRYVQEKLTQQKLVQQKHFVLMPLYGSLPLNEQQKAMQPVENGKRKILFTTNIAETSLTIEGITCVIDSGLEKRLSFEPSSGMSALVSTKISKASAEQRKGRAGRLSEGKCIRLWSEQTHYALDDYQPEEIMNADLADIILLLASAGHIHYNSIEWLTAPPKAHFDATVTLLISLGLLDSSCKITPLGEQACKLPVHVRLARMILMAKQPQAKALACYIAVLLSENKTITSHDSVDLLPHLYVLLEHKIQRQQSYNSSIKNLKALMNDVKRLMSLIHVKELNSETLNVTDTAAYLLLLAYPERLAKRRSEHGCTYQLANGKGVILHEQDALLLSEFLVVNACDAGSKEGRVFSAVSMSKSILFDEFSHDFSIDVTYELSKGTGKVYAKVFTKYGNIILEETRNNNVPAHYFLNSISAMLKDDFKTLLNWTTACEQWLTRACWLSQHWTDFTTVTKQSIVDNIDEWLLPYLTKVNSLTELKKVNVLPLLTAQLDYQQTLTLNEQAPTHYLTPSNKKVAIVYDENKGPTVSVVLQEVLGELASPLLANNQIALRFELLSPARRPIQITSDLANFWRGSYLEVAKEMRSKYPKHRWPVDPFSEKPGRSFKR